MNTQGRSQPEKQNSTRGYIKTSETWDVNEQSFRIDEKNGTFRIDESNLGRARQRMAIKTLVVGCFFII